AVGRKGGARAVGGQHTYQPTFFYRRCEAKQRSQSLAREGRMTVTIGRRELLAALGGAATAWPLAAWAQQPDGMRRIGVLMGLAEDDQATRARLAAFRQGLEKRGWSEERNVRVEYRFAPASAQAQVLAKELVALRPEVILAHTTPVTAAL